MKLVEVNQRHGWALAEQPGSHIRGTVMCLWNPHAAAYRSRASRVGIPQVAAGTVRFPGPLPRIQETIPVHAGTSPRLAHPS